MHQDIATTGKRYQGFARTIIAEGQVWGLASSKGFINTPSREFENSQVVPFWATEALAEAAAKEGWENLKPAAIPLCEFLENWLVGMYNKGLLAGINWDLKNFGEEVEPLDLALEISNQLIAAGIEEKLTKYKDIRDYQAQVKQTVETA